MMQVFYCYKQICIHQKTLPFFAHLTKIVTQKDWNCSNLSGWGVIIVDYELQFPFVSSYKKCFVSLLDGIFPRSSLFGGRMLFLQQLQGKVHKVILSCKRSKHHISQYTNIGYYWFLIENNNSSKYSSGNHQDATNFNNILHMYSRIKNNVTLFYS